MRRLAIACSHPGSPVAVRGQHALAQTSSWLPQTGSALCADCGLRPPIASLRCQIKHKQPRTRYKLYEACGFVRLISQGATWDSSRDFWTCARPQTADPTCPDHSAHLRTGHCASRVQHHSMSMQNNTTTILAQHARFRSVAKSNSNPRTTSTNRTELQCWAFDFAARSKGAPGGVGGVELLVRR